MPYFPELPVWEKTVLNTQQFLGLNRGLSIQDGEMADMLNMSCDNFPVLSTRQKRGTPTFRPDAAITPDLLGQVDGMLGTDKLVVCHDGKVYYDGEEVPITLSTDPSKREKKLVSMGAYVCIWPDKKYFNVNNLDDCGDMGYRWEGTEGEEITAMMCRRDGTDYDMEQIVVSALPPETPSDGDFWLDTSQDVDVLRQYSLLYKEWVQVPTTYIKIQAPGIGKGLKNFDTAWLSGVRAVGDPDPDNPEAGGEVEDQAGEYHFTGKDVRIDSKYTISGSSVGTPSVGTSTQTFKLEGVPENATIVSAKLKFTVFKHDVTKTHIAEVNGIAFATERAKYLTHEVELKPSRSDEISVNFRYQILPEYFDTSGTSGVISFLEVSDIQLDVVWEVINSSGANKAELNRLNTSNIIYGAGDDYIIVAGILHNHLTLSKALTVELKVPDFDYVCESNNRIWGCIYQELDGTVLNELHCCALGDFRNWHKYQGTAADSYTVTLGSEGKFTGAYSYQGVPIFFKEGHIHKLTGTIPANYTVGTIKGRGVQDGSWKSVATVNETLFYKSRTEIMAYEGAMPYAVSTKLGSDVYTGAVGGGYRDKYYICMQDEALKWHTYVMDVTKGLWHQEGMERISHMANAGGELVLAIQEDSSAATRTAESTHLRTVSSKNTVEDTFDWMVTFGTLGFQSEQQKYLSRYNIRAQMSSGSHMKVEMQYDSDGKWVHMGTMKSVRLQTFLLPIIPRRCDHCQLRISGRGTINIYSVAREYENGGDG